MNCTAYPWKGNCMLQIIREGRVPLQTIGAKIDCCSYIAPTIYWILLGIKNNKSLCSFTIHPERKIDPKKGQTLCLEFRLLGITCFLWTLRYIAYMEGSEG